MILQNDQSVEAVNSRIVRIRTPGETTFRTSRLTANITLGSACWWSFSRCGFVDEADVDDAVELAALAAEEIKSFRRSGR